MNKLKELADSQNGILHIEQVAEWIKEIETELLELMEDVAGYTDDDIFLGEYRAYKKVLEMLQKGGVDNAN